MHCQEFPDILKNPAKWRRIQRKISRKTKLRRIKAHSGKIKQKITLKRTLMTILREF